MSAVNDHDLFEKIKTRQARVGVIGLGYVGLPLALEMCRAGFNVVGVDIDRGRVSRLQNGESYIIDVPADEVRRFVAEGRLYVSSDYADLAAADTISICVPTPLRKTKDPDISYIVAAMDGIVEHMHHGILIILESTTYPGTTEELIQKRIEELGYEVGKDFFLCFSPERVDPGNKIYHTKNTPKVIGGVTPKCRELAHRLYGSVLDNIVLVSSTRLAEMVKLLENTFRSVNIGLVNELALMCDRMDIDVWEVIDAAATKPFGFMPFYPGPGIGGHCIPLDPMYLSWKAKMYDFYNKFIELASDINGNMPRYVVNKVAEMLNIEKKSINGARILILGMAYKRDIDDLRESPGLEVFRLLEEYGAAVDYNDPHALSFIHHDGGTVRSVPLEERMLKDYDCAVLTTNHSVYDYPWIARHARLILDTRNAFKSCQAANIYRLGTGEIRIPRKLRQDATEAAPARDRT